MKKKNQTFTTKSLPKLLAMVVTATTKVVAKNMFSNENQLFATTFVVIKNDFSYGEIYEFWRHENTKHGIESKKEEKKLKVQNPKGLEAKI